MSLRVAIDAHLPLIAVSTRDTLNFPDVIQEIAGKEATKFSPEKTPIGPGKLYYKIIRKAPPGMPVQVPDFDALYPLLMAKEASLLIVNSPVVTDAMFDAGEVPVPKSMLYGLMHHVTEDEKKARGMLRALGGVTIKECAELAQLTMARDGGLTAQGIVATRKQFFQGQRGLTLVESHQDFYLPDPELAEWIERERPFFVNEGVDPRLVPRGLLLDGPPGVGKTSGAKYIADRWGVPLYRFDLSGTKDKYVGQSERFMSANLQRIDQEEPCVVLFDEVEKSFSVTHFGGDGNTSSGMLSQLLWWLAEHRSRVLAIMTTNDARKLPPELHRERRIDRSMELQGLSLDEAEGFVEALLKTFSIFGDNDLLDGHVETIVQSIKLPPEEEGRISHAALTEVIYSHVKQLQTHLSSGD